MVSIRTTTLPRIDRYFDWRGKDVSRVEGFSDAVFALMLTLLVVSSVVPDSFGRLFEIMEDFPAFALTFAVLVWFWVEHYRGGIRSSLIHVGLGATSICLALVLSRGLLALSGMIYFLIGPAMFVNGWMQGRAVERAARPE